MESRWHVVVTWEPEAVELGSWVIGVGTLVVLATVASVREHTLPSHLGCTHQLHARPLVARASAGVARSPSSADELDFLLSAQQTNTLTTHKAFGWCTGGACSCSHATHHRLLSGWWQVVFKARSGEVDSALHVAVFNLVECALVWLVAIEAGVDVGSFRWALLYVSAPMINALQATMALQVKWPTMALQVKWPTMATTLFRAAVEHRAHSGPVAGNPGDQEYAALASARGQQWVTAALLRACAVFILDQLRMCFMQWWLTNRARHEQPSVDVDRSGSHLRVRACWSRVGGVVDGCVCSAGRDKLHSRWWDRAGRNSGQRTAATHYTVLLR
jgi:hypothetical protein